VPLLEQLSRVALKLETSGEKWALSGGLEAMTSVAKMVTLGMVGW